MKVFIITATNAVKEAKQKYKLTYIYNLNKKVCFITMTNVVLEAKQKVMLNNI